MHYRFRSIERGHFRFLSAFYLHPNISDRFINWASYFISVKIFRYILRGWNEQFLIGPKARKRSSWAFAAVSNILCRNCSSNIWKDIVVILEVRFHHDFFDETPCAIVHKSIFKQYFRWKSRWSTSTTSTRTSKRWAWLPVVVELRSAPDYKKELRIQRKQNMSEK